MTFPFNHEPISKKLNKLKQRIKTFFLDNTIFIAWRFAKEKSVISEFYWVIFFYIVLPLSLIFSAYIILNSVLNYCIFCEQYYYLILAGIDIVVFVVLYNFVYKNPKNFLHIFKINCYRKLHSKFTNQHSTQKRTSAIFFAIILSFLIAFLIIIGFIAMFESKEAINNLTPKGIVYEFKYLYQLIILAPITFAIWLFRDQNKLKELENGRKDTNLKEFQQLQQLATGNISSNGDEQNKTALQISALHSLRAYLAGEFGDSFKRGAYEIFRSVLKTQHDKIFEQLKDVKKESMSYKITTEIQKDSLTQQINIIAKEDWFNLLINHDFPTSHISLVGVDLKDAYLKHKNYAKNLDLSYANLSNANLYQANLTNANLYQANLTNADLMGSNLFGADLTYSNLTNANLNDSNLSNAKLHKTNLSNANLINANLSNADLSNGNAFYVNSSNVNSSRAGLINADLSNADLSYANLYKANLTKANLSFADLTNASSLGANFKDAILDGVKGYTKTKTPQTTKTNNEQNKQNQKTKLTKQTNKH